MFRPPTHPTLLASQVGSGVQILGMTLVTQLFALLGFLSPANRGGLMTAMILMFTFMGLVSGYAAARLYKGFRGDQWKAMTLRTCLIFPGALLGGCVAAFVARLDAAHLPHLAGCDAVAWLCRVSAGLSSVLLLLAMPLHACLMLCLLTSPPYQLRYPACLPSCTVR